MEVTQGLQRAVGRGPAGVRWFAALLQQYIICDKKIHNGEAALQPFLKGNGTAVLPEASIFGDMV